LEGGKRSIRKQKVKSGYLNIKMTDIEIPIVKAQDATEGERLFICKRNMHQRFTNHGSSSQNVLIVITNT